MPVELIEGWTVDELAREPAWHRPACSDPERDECLYRVHLEREEQYHQRSRYRQARGHKDDQGWPTPPRHRIEQGWKVCPGRCWRRRYHPDDRRRHP